MSTAFRRQDTGRDGKGEPAEAPFRCLAGGGRAAGEHPPDCHPKVERCHDPRGPMRPCVKP